MSVNIDHSRPTASLPVRIICVVLCLPLLVVLAIPLAILLAVNFYQRPVAPRQLRHAENIVPLGELSLKI